MQNDEAAVLKKFVDRHGRRVADPQDCTDRVRAAAQMTQGAEKLQAVALFLERVVLPDPAHQLDLLGVNLVALAFAL